MEVSRGQIITLNGPKYDYPKFFSYLDIHDFDLDVFEKIHVYAIALPPNWWRYLFYRLFQYMFYKYDIESDTVIRAMECYLFERDPEKLREMRMDLREETYGFVRTKGHTLSWMVYEFVNGTGAGVMAFLLGNFDAKEKGSWIYQSVVELLLYLQDNGVDWLKPKDRGPTLWEN
jgi:hypothetical protein